MSVEQHRQYTETGHSLLALADHRPVGFLLSEPLDDALFIVEISVHQQWQGQVLAAPCLAKLSTTPAATASRR